MTPASQKPVEAAHTPGPWKLAATHVYRRGKGKRGANICSCGEPRAKTEVGYTELEIGSPDIDEAFANARLISAAPEMLDALERTYLFKADLPPKVRKIVAAAIAKATGAAS